MAAPTSVEGREPLAEELREPGAILLISCYELGHQPLGIASPLGFLERAGYAPDALDGRQPGEQGEGEEEGG